MAKKTTKPPTKHAPKTGGFTNEFITKLEQAVAYSRVTSQADKTALLGALHAMKD